MLRTPDPRHWMILVFVRPGGLPGHGEVVCAYVTETDELDIAVARAELNGAAAPGTSVTMTRFLSTGVHPDWLDIPLSALDFQQMPEPQNCTKL